MITEKEIEEKLHIFLQDLKKECNSDKQAIVVIKDYIKLGKISAEQETLLKTQVFDTLKILGIGIPFVLIPGASILMPLLVHIANKNGIDLMPKAFEN